ncbi:MAG: LysR family transcriptional regulator [Anaerolineales bacterium]|jgi:DNA-binding transcriptional LysR family regulator
MIDLTRLQVFLAAAETLSFSEAAQRLHISQPTVSHHVKKLEEEIGSVLFDRSGGEINLTSAGRLLVPHARKLLREAMGIQQMMNSMEDRVIGSLRIACSTTTGKYILPQFAGRFLNRHPGVTIRVNRCTRTKVVPILLGEEADLGVVSFDACGDDMDCQEFFTDHIILISPASQPWTAMDSIDPSDLLGVPLILDEPSSGTRRALLTELGKHDIDIGDLNIFLEVGNAEAIVKTVESGFGLAFVPLTSARWALSQATVVQIPVHGFDLHRRIFMVRKKLHPANRAMEAFWAFVHDPSNKDLLSMAES